MLTEKFKLSEKKENYNYTLPDIRNKVVLEIYGSGPVASWYKKTTKYTSWDSLDDVDIAILSYFATGYICRENATKFFPNRDWEGKIPSVDTKNKVNEGPLAFILPYLWDDMEIVDEYWTSYDGIHIYVYDDNYIRHEYELPKIYDLFDTIDDLVAYIKEQMKIVRPSRLDDEGIMVEPWEIDEAREVLAAAGWTEQELRYLRWVGHDRAFAAPIEIRQKWADVLAIIIKEKIDADPDNADTYKWVDKTVFDALREANKKCKDIGFNGPMGLCGTYIYRITPEVEADVIEYSDPDEIVELPDGRKYKLHEGD